jgi:hypothetical protein
MKMDPGERLSEHLGSTLEVPYHKNITSYKTIKNNFKTLASLFCYEHTFYIRVIRKLLEVTDMYFVLCCLIAVVFIRADSVICHWLLCSARK